MSIHKIIKYTLFIVMLLTIVALLQNRVGDSDLLILAISPVISFFRYGAEVFALAEISRYTTEGISYWNFLFGWPVVKIGTLLGDQGSIYYLNDFRTEFFDVGRLGYSNVVHPFPAMLYASGGLLGYIVGVALLMSILIFLLVYALPVGYLFFYIFIYRGFFGIPNLAWHDILVLIIAFLYLNRFNIFHYR